uniref:integumentary mucin C.1-like isoform X2 n=1 Tax=Styela clava TaxID=7725 RepID=UPI00193ADA19|nr:integumentary mucin C.1-like isoform X2 [Styela clava]
MEFILRFTFVIFTSMTLVTTTSPCQHYLLGQSGNVTFPNDLQQTVLQSFYTDGLNLTAKCVYAKNINMKSLALTFKDIVIEAPGIKIETIKKNLKSPWETYRELTGNLPEIVIEIRGVKYLKIVVQKNAGSFILDYKVEKTPDIKCRALPDKVKTIKCSKSRKAGSKCTLTCRDGFVHHEFINMKTESEFGVICRKISRRSAIWQPSLDKTLCRNGRKIKKECKKIKFCVPVPETTSLVFMNNINEETTTKMNKTETVTSPSMVETTKTNQTDTVKSPTTIETTKTNKTETVTSPSTEETTKQIKPDTTIKLTPSTTEEFNWLLIKPIARNTQTPTQSKQQNRNTEPALPGQPISTRNPNPAIIKVLTRNEDGAKLTPLTDMNKNTTIFLSKEIEPTPPTHLYPTHSESNIVSKHTEPTPPSHLYPDVQWMNVIEHTTTFPPATTPTTTTTTPTTTTTTPTTTSTIPTTSTTTLTTTTTTSTTTRTTPTTTSTTPTTTTTTPTTTTTTPTTTTTTPTTTTTTPTTTTTTPTTTTTTPTTTTTTPTTTTTTPTTTRTTPATSTVTTMRATESTSASTTTATTRTTTATLTTKVNTPRIILFPPLTIKYCKRFCKRKRYTMDYAHSCGYFKGIGKKEFCMMCRYSQFKPCKQYSHFV